MPEVKIVTTGGRQKGKTWVTQVTADDVVACTALLRQHGHGIDGACLWIKDKHGRWVIYR